MVSLGFRVKVRVLGTNRLPGFYYMITYHCGNRLTVF